MASQYEEFCSGIDTITSSIASTRDGLRQLRTKEQILDMKEGISLLSLKSNYLLSYLRSLVLLSSRRAIGHSTKTHSFPTGSFGTSNRDSRGHNAGDIVDSMIECRAVLEKVGVLESKMRYQIEKLVHVVEQSESVTNVADDPLAFRPNPLNLMLDRGEDYATTSHSNSRYTRNESHADSEDLIYRPPRLAPAPYKEKTKNQMRKERPPIPSALASLASDLSRPYIEATTGLGGTPALASGRAGYLKRLTEFEEENFTRMVMKKSDARRRARDEEDLALGGGLGGAGNGSRRRAGGLEDEFGDVLRSVDRFGGGQGQGDGYDELRQKGKRGDVLERSRRVHEPRTHKDAFGDQDEQGSERMRKRSRFQLEAKSAKKMTKRRTK